MARIHLLERTQRIDRPIAEVFPFYADAGNLERITPPWLGFEMITPTPIATGLPTPMAIATTITGTTTITATTINRSMQ